MKIKKKNYIQRIDHFIQFFFFFENVSKHESDNLCFEAMIKIFAFTIALNYYRVFNSYTKKIFILLDDEYFKSFSPKNADFVTIFKLSLCTNKSLFSKTR